MMFEDKLSLELAFFSKWIKVSDLDIDRGRRLGDQIFTWIKTNSKFKPDRCRFGGSFAKGTSTFLKVDVDVTIYINFEGDKCNSHEVLYFLQRVREDWKDVLMLNTDLTEEDLSSGKNTVKFELQDFHFDLCPAINVSQDTNVQVSETLRIYQETDAENNKIGTCLDAAMSEAAVQFVKNQSEYVRDLCRLTKFWQQGISYFRFKSGRSMLFECIAIR